MNLDMAQLSALSPVIFMINSFLGLATECLKLAQLKKQKELALYFDDTFTTINDRSIQITKSAASLFILIFLLSLGVLFFMKTNAPQNGAVPSIEPTVFESSTPSLPVEEPYITLNSIWLDDVSPMIAQNGNFFFQGWEGLSKFSLDDRSYTHGIGMRICGTSSETRVETEYCPGNINRDDCNQAYIDFALRSKYESLSFSVGADNSNTDYYGIKSKNGIARIMLIDLDRNDILFDSGWKDYRYTEYDNSISLKKVDDLRIVYMTCGIQYISPKHGLQFALVNPVLTLVGD